MKNKNEVADAILESRTYRMVARAVLVRKFFHVHAKNGPEVQDINAWSSRVVNNVRGTQFPIASFTWRTSKWRKNECSSFIICYHGHRHEAEIANASCFGANIPVFLEGKGELADFYYWTDFFCERPVLIKTGRALTSTEYWKWMRTNYRKNTI